MGFRLRNTTTDVKVEIATESTVNLGLHEYVFEFAITNLGFIASTDTIFASDFQNFRNGIFYSNVGNLALRQGGSPRISSGNGFILQETDRHVYRFEHDSNGDYRFIRDGVLFSSGVYTENRVMRCKDFYDWGSGGKNEAPLWDLEYFKIEGWNHDETWNPSLSNGSGDILPSQSGLRDGTLVNYPTDDSQWVFYDDGGEQEGSSQHTFTAIGTANTTSAKSVAISTVAQAVAQAATTSAKTIPTAISAEATTEALATSSKAISTTILGSAVTQSSTASFKTASTSILADSLADTSFSSTKQSSSALFATATSDVFFNVTKAVETSFTSSAVGVASFTSQAIEEDVGSSQHTFTAIAQASFSSVKLGSSSVGFSASTASQLVTTKAVATTMLAEAVGTTFFTSTEFQIGTSEVYGVALSGSSFTTQKDVSTAISASASTASSQDYEKVSNSAITGAAVADVLLEHFKISSSIVTARAVGDSFFTGFNATNPIPEVRYTINTITGTYMAFDSKPVLRESITTEVL